MMNATSRRGFLAALGFAGASAAVPLAAAVVTPTPVIEESKDSFEHPADYLAAMQAIGWSATASFMRDEDDEIIRMGVNERSSSPEEMQRTWRRFHAIQMRCPVQLPFDVHPHQDWWGRVWQHLYDKGLRKDVTSEFEI